MTNKENLVLEVGPQQLVSYGKLLVAFYDDFKEKVIDENGNAKPAKDAEPSLHIHIQNSDDKYSIVKRKADIRRNQAGNRAKEEHLFAKAYAKYLEIKNNGGLVDGEKAALTSQNEILMAKIAKMEADAAKAEVKEEVETEAKEEKVEVTKTTKKTK
jgi:hypothetical protein